MASINQNNGRVLGQAESTATLRRSGLPVHAAYRIQRDLPLEMHYDEIRGEYLELYYNTFMQWLTKTAIPINSFVDNLNPTNPNNKRCCTTATLKGYIGQVFKSFPVTFPDHEDYINKNDTFFPSWYTQLRIEFEEDHNRFFIDNADGDIQFGTTKIVPLYRDNATPLMPTRFNLCDLKKMFLNMIHRSDGTNDLMEQRAEILFIYLVMARVGEVRFENYSDWEWHDALQVVNTWWTDAYGSRF